MNAPSFFSHGDHAVARRLRGREMDVAHLGQRVSDRVVNRAFADFAAFDVRDRDSAAPEPPTPAPAFRNDPRSAKASPDASAPENVGEAQRGHADGLGHAHVAVGAEQAFHARVDVEAFLLDFLNGRSRIPAKGARLLQ